MTSLFGTVIPSDIGLGSLDPNSPTSGSITRVDIIIIDTDGDGTRDKDDLDDDGDGVPDTKDVFPLDKTESVDTDGDGIGDNSDLDDDGDGVPDTKDVFPLDKTESVDTDGDGIGDNSDPEDDRENANIIQFVERFYQEVLGRTADDAGLSDWVSKLVDGTKTGADIAKGFIFSQEFTNQGNSNEAFLNILYKAFFNRTADSGGFTAWRDKLNQGTSREDVLNGFLYSTEFSNLAESYGIKAVPDTPTTLIENFVKRFYSEVLNREADTGGLTDWVNRLQSKTSTGSDIATGFVFSDEFKNRNTDDVTFLEILYKAFFGREFDEGGLNGWLNQLEQGVSREDVLNGFLYSTEFVNLCEKYGIIAYLTNLNASQGSPKIYALHSSFFTYSSDLGMVPDIINVGDYTFAAGASFSKDGSNTYGCVVDAPITGENFWASIAYGKILQLSIDNHLISYDSNGNIYRIQIGYNGDTIYEGTPSSEDNTHLTQLNKNIYHGIYSLDNELARLISFLEARQNNNELNNFLKRGIVRHALGVTNFIVSQINSGIDINTIETSQGFSWSAYERLNQIGKDLRGYHEIENYVPQYLDYDKFGEIYAIPSFHTDTVTMTGTPNTTNTETPTGGITYIGPEGTESATATEFLPSYSRENNIENAGILAEVKAENQCRDKGKVPGITTEYETIGCVTEQLFGETLYYCQVRTTILCSYEN